MRIRILLSFLVTAALISAATETRATVLLDRLYRMGDSPDNEGASNGGSVNKGDIFDSFDDANTRGFGEAADFRVVTGDPRYTATTGRPDGENSFGIRFDGDDALAAARLGLPSTSATSISGNNYDFSGIADRGFQLWVNADPFNPQSVGVQSIVMDTNQHGLQINDDGNFSMAYAGGSFDSSVSAAGGGWFHAMVVRPQGAAGGSRLYIDGNAVAFAPGGYNGGDTADLVVGANTGGDELDFTGANDEFFSGTVDDLKMFVIGAVASAPNPDTGSGPENFLSQTVESFTSVFDLALDNDFIFFKRTENVGGANPQPVNGDLNLDGTFDGHLPGGADRAQFLAGWFNKNEVNGQVLGDLSTFQNGDLDFSGITDILDLVEFQGLIAAQGGAAISSAELAAAVPEPQSLVIMIVAGLATVLARSRVRP